MPKPQLTEIVYPAPELLRAKGLDQVLFQRYRDYRKAEKEELRLKDLAERRSRALKGLQDDPVAHRDLCDVMGVTGLELRLERAVSLSARSYAAFVASPARTLDGAILKLEVALEGETLYVNPAEICVQDLAYYEAMRDLKRLASARRGAVGHQARSLEARSRSPVTNADHDRHLLALYNTVGVWSLITVDGKKAAAVSDDLLGGFILCGVVVAIYFIPTFVASQRNHKNTGAVFALNLLLGWTLLGWVAALVWAMAGNAAPVQGTEKKCPSCAEMVKREARKCRFCGHEFASAAVR